MINNRKKWQTISIFDSFLTISCLALSCNFILRNIADNLFFCFEVCENLRPVVAERRKVHEFLQLLPYFCDEVGWSAPQLPSILQLVRQFIYARGLQQKQKRIKIVHLRCITFQDSFTSTRFRLFMSVHLTVIIWHNAQLGSVFLCFAYFILSNGSSTSGKACWMKTHSEEYVFHSSKFGELLGHVNYAKTN